MLLTQYMPRDHNVQTSGEFRRDVGPQIPKACLLKDATELAQERVRFHTNGLPILDHLLGLELERLRISPASVLGAAFGPAARAIPRKSLR